LVIAAGFGIAALTVTLTQVYGAALSYTIMAGFFVAVGGITAHECRARSRKSNRKWKNHRKSC
jgi:hypothetical protein